MYIKSLLSPEVLYFSEQFPSSPRSALWCSRHYFLNHTLFLLVLPTTLQEAAIIIIITISVWQMGTLSPREAGQLAQGQCE